ncbi:MAG: hypothetical protein AAF322_17675, partial [Pseudomonadota bacterium]
MSLRDNLWSVLPLPALTVNIEDVVTAANGAAEAFLGVGESHLKGRTLQRLFGESARLIELVRIARRDTATAADHNVDFGWPGRPEAHV